MHELKITFPNKRVRDIFATWMCDGGGEQQFAEACANEGIEIHLGLSYHGPEKLKYPANDARRYGKFLCDDTIRVRLTTDEERAE